MSLRGSSRQFPDRWVAGLVACGAIDDPSELRFAAFSLGELASDVVLGPVRFARDPVSHARTYELATNRRAPRCHTHLASASTRSGIVAVTGTDVLIAPARTAHRKPRAPIGRARVEDISVVQAFVSHVAATLHDGSVAQFSFPRRLDAVRFLSLW